jgi:hypothetical protein
MNHVGEFLTRAAKTMGFRRDAYVEKNMPNVTSNLMVVPFFGDMRSTIILSMFVLKPLRELYREKYLIVVSWPGYEALFPYADEFWTLDDQGVVKILATGADNFSNSADLSTDLTRRLIEHFSHVVRYSDIKQYYFNGFQKKYWDDFGGIKRFFPEVASASLIDDSFRTQVVSRPGDKVVIYPVKRVRSWQKDKIEYLKAPQQFWVCLVEQILSAGIMPMVYQDVFTYDLSRDFTDRCLYMVPSKIQGSICAMRYVGCVLDMFSGISRLAVAARTPFVCIDERMRYMNHGEYEIDDLTCEGLPKNYMFSFGGLPLVGGPEEWKVNVINGAIAKLKAVLPVDTSNLPPTKESYEPVSYDKVRTRKSKRLGVHFIKSSKLR